MSSASPAKKPYAPRLPAAERREQLLDAAQRIALERGFHAVSVDGVAKACGVTRPVVYGVFEDRTAMLAALWFKLPETGKASDRQAQAGLFADYKTLLRSRSFDGFVLQGGCAMAAFLAFSTGAPYVLTQTRELSATAVGLWFATVSVGFAAGSLLASRLPEKLPLGLRAMAGSALALAAAIVALVLTWAFQAKRDNMPRGEKLPARKRWEATFAGVWALLLPVLIVGGLKSGYFTPTEAAVVAVPDDKWDERPLACVVRSADVSAADLRAFLDGKVAKWWLPERWTWIDEVPKTSVGKFKKTALREQFAEEQVPASS